MGGIGKTALAQTYATFYCENYAHVAWVQQISDDFRQDLISAEGLLHSLNIDATGTVDELFPRVIHQLRALENQPNLLVIDNAFASLTKIKDQLPKQPDWHILITSREAIVGFEVKELGFLSETAAIDLFKRHYTLTKLQNTDIAAIVKAIDYHTLTIELLAKIAQRKRATLDELLTAIKDDITANVSINHTQGGDKVERIHSYLCSIFKVDKLSKQEIHLLKQLTCLPTEFHTYEILEDLLTLKEDFDFTLSEILESLKESGWLIADSKNDSYKMHQIIQLALFTQLNVQLDDVTSLVENIINKLSLDQTKDNPIEKFPWIPFGKTVYRLFIDLIDVRDFSLQKNLIDGLKWVGDYGEAKDLLEKKLAFNMNFFGEKSLETAKCYSDLGAMLHGLGDLHGAKNLHEKAMLLAEVLSEEVEPKIAAICSDLALVLKDLGDFQGAKVLLEKAVRIYVEYFGEDSPITAIGYSNLGLLLQELGDLKNAKVLQGKALDSQGENFINNHLNTTIYYSNLALVLDELGDIEAARALLEKAVFLDEKIFGKAHPITASNYSNLAIVLHNHGDIKGAKDLLEKFIDFYEKVFGENHPKTAIGYSNLGVLLQEVGDLERAKVLLEKAMSSARKIFEDQHPVTIVRSSNLGLVLKDLGDLQGAKTLLRSSMVLAEKVYGDGHPINSICYSNLGTVLQDLGDFEGAKALFEKALISIKKNFGEDYPAIAIYYSNLGLAFKSLGYLSKAKELYEKALSLDLQNLGENHLKTGICYYNLAVLLYELESYQRAYLLIKKAKKVFENTYPEDHAYIENACLWCEEIKTKLI
ncbi:hypothetical protein MAH1_06460 [Sessilibacter sp. MAH1]